MKQIEHALLTAILERGQAGTDDAHAMYELPETVDPRTWGSVTNGLQARGLIQRVGDSHTRRRVAHGRRIGRYIVTDRKLALKYCKRLARAAARKRRAQRSLFDREG
ncbi:MAG: hypothetical protein HQ518_33185 [Rhodopirellula sp.]|nr:hypothetical protein [Rhodopirellula sp.]